MYKKLNDEQKIEFKTICNLKFGESNFCGYIKSHNDSDGQPLYNTGEPNMVHDVDDILLEILGIRPKGYYWVKTKTWDENPIETDWFIAEWDGCYFWCNGDDLGEEMMVEIDENRIIKK